MEGRRLPRVPATHREGRLRQPPRLYDQYQAEFPSQVQGACNKPAVNASPQFIVFLDQMQKQRPQIRMPALVPPFHLGESSHNLSRS